MNTPCNEHHTPCLSLSGIIRILLVQFGNERHIFHQGVNLGIPEILGKKYLIPGKKHPDPKLNSWPDPTQKYLKCPPTTDCFRFGPGKLRILSCPQVCNTNCMEYIIFFFERWWYKRGLGGICPSMKAWSLHFPLLEGKTWQKSAILVKLFLSFVPLFWFFIIFCPVTHILPHW